MARMVSRSRPKEGIGIGERMTEIIIFIGIAAALIGAGYWYFGIYLKSPENAIKTFVGAMNSRSIDVQYKMLAASTKQKFKTQDEYVKDFPPSEAYASRIATSDFKKSKETSEACEMDVKMTVRKVTDSLIETASSTYNDHYIMHKESGEWKLVLEKSKLESLSGVGRR